MIVVEYVCECDIRFSKYSKIYFVRCVVIFVYER